MPDNDDDTPALTLPAFTPVPRLKDRSNGWKPEVQRAFIEALAETGSVKAACRRVGRADAGAYQLRHHPEAGEFRAAWDAALDCGIRRLEDHAMDRALYGDLTTYLPDQLLAKSDVSAMAFGLETRSPFLGREILEYAATLPTALRLQDWNTKHLLKRVTRKRQEARTSSLMVMLAEARRRSSSAETWAPRASHSAMSRR